MNEIRNENAELLELIKRMKKENEKNKRNSKLEKSMKSMLDAQSKDLIEKLKIKPFKNLYYERENEFNYVNEKQSSF